MRKNLTEGTIVFYKGGLLTLVLVAGVYLLVHLLLYWAGLINTLFYGLLVGVGVFYCLAGKTLITEVKTVFEAVDRSVEEGRVQVGRIVGRDTSWFISPGDKGGCTGNTRRKPERRSDRPHVLVCFSGIARHDGLQNDQYARFDDRYKNDRYKDFGQAAARLDDVANYIPGPVDSLPDAAGFRQLE